MSSSHSVAPLCLDLEPLPTELCVLFSLPSCSFCFCIAWFSQNGPIVLERQRLTSFILLGDPRIGWRQLWTENLMLIVLLWQREGGPPVRVAWFPHTTWCASFKAAEMPGIEWWREWYNVMFFLKDLPIGKWCQIWGTCLIKVTASVGTSGC